jgi:hypothetical protein
MLCITLYLICTYQIIYIVTEPRVATSTWLSANGGVKEVISLRTDHKDWEKKARTVFIGIYGETKL